MVGTASVFLMFCVNRYLFTMFVIKLFLSYQDEDREHDPVQRQEASLEEDQAEAVDERFLSSSSEVPPGGAQIVSRGLPGQAPSALISLCK